MSWKVLNFNKVFMLIINNSNVLNKVYLLTAIRKIITFIFDITTLRIYIGSVIVVSHLHLVLDI